MEAFIERGNRRCIYIIMQSNVIWYILRCSAFLKKIGKCSFIAYCLATFETSSVGHHLSQ